ncbi:hypothetical protein ACO0LM_11915 [Undibacterium sp. Di26W]|uniref:hypothetical protein n=1 Tax=Undibacterium sp. Di26W TaxID=3413035 RepID=UPI003BF1990A
MKSILETIDGAIDLNRVIIRENVYWIDGRLHVAAGAAGTIVGRNQGFLDVLFDAGPAYVELSGCGQRLQSVPVLSTCHVKVETE